jgi:hypothetical protein|tara:strand:+ start:278 stop:631 length:354 start_codon:yes stop_codon:yes gene_type:complete
MKKFIKVSFQKEGIHKWPDAKDVPGVEFLQYPHRHIFHFYVTLEVMHDNREVEFILFKRELEKQYDVGTLQLDYQSCEMMAESLINYIEEYYPGRATQVEVYEDNENGAIVQNDLFN